MLQNRAHDGPDRATARQIEPLERALRRVVGRLRDEVAPELADEEARVVGMRYREMDGVLPRERAAAAEDRLDAGIVVARVVAEVDAADALAPVVAEAGERPRLLPDVGLAVAPTGAEREELHH